MSLTIGRGDRQLELELAAPPDPTPTPTPEPTPFWKQPRFRDRRPRTITLPPTDVGQPAAPWQAIDARWLLVGGAVIAFALLSLREFAYRRIR